MRIFFPFVTALLAMSMLAGCTENRSDSMVAEHDSGLEEQTIDSTCSYAGESYASGDVVQKSSSVSCICQDDGTLGRCTGALPEPDGGVIDDDDDATCTFEGTDYAVGDVIPKGPSVTCMCLAGGEIGYCTGVLPER